MADINELYSLFRRNFPYIIRGEAAVRALLGDPENHIITRSDASGTLIAASVIHKNAIYLFCVDAGRRSCGIGGGLLAETEEYILRAGYGEAVIGAGEDYIMPGVPARSMPFSEELMLGDIYSGVTDDAWRFFEKRGYKHSWVECNCFDMRQNLDDFTYNEHAVGDIIGGIEYRWAKKTDIGAVARCTDDAHAEFTRYYMDASLYAPESSRRVLAAVDHENVCGALIVSRGAEGAGIGSLGCTSVANAWRGRHIAANMVLLGSRYLKEHGVKTGFLGYTYSGLDRLYGIAGYKICVYYAMAKKTLVAQQHDIMR